MKLLHYSKVGYDTCSKKVAYLSIEGSDVPNSFCIIANGKPGYNPDFYTSTPRYYGEKWGRNWYVLDFSAFNRPGTYKIRVMFDQEEVKSDSQYPIDIGENLLWNRTWHAISLEQLEARKAAAYKPEGGFRDCGSPLQEVSSHLIMLDSLCDLTECIELSFMDQLREDIAIGTEYILKCMDKAVELGYKEGAVVHEIRENLSVSTGNCARVAVVLSRIGKILNCNKYIDKAMKAFHFIYENGPIIYTDDTGNLNITHGATIDMSTPPQDFMTRDFMSLLEASINFMDMGYKEYEQKVDDILDKILVRQVTNPEGGFYGHFYTYSNVDFTEKADLHCGAWNAPYKNYNQGAHMPYWILPLIKLAEKGGKYLEVCDTAVRNFAYGFLLPTTKQTPFGIIPLGYYKETGLSFFSGCYHAHNKIYGFIAKLCMELYHYLGDEQFKNMATDNIQWLMGNNCGYVKEWNDNYVSKSFVVGVGTAYYHDWDCLRGTVINGFDANRQFLVQEIGEDLPNGLDDEGGIHHSSGCLSGICAVKK